jgi:hypothetical protein
MFSPRHLEHQEFHEALNQLAAEDDNKDGEDNDESSSESEKSDNSGYNNEEFTSEGDKRELHAPPARTSTPPPPLPQQSPLRRYTKDIQSEGSLFG